MVANQSTFDQLDILFNKNYKKGVNLIILPKGWMGP